MASHTQNSSNTVNQGVYYSLAKQIIESINADIAIHRKRSSSTNLIALEETLITLKPLAVITVSSELGDELLKRVNWLISQIQTCTHITKTGFKKLPMAELLSHFATEAN